MRELPCIGLVQNGNGSVFLCLELEVNIFLCAISYKLANSRQPFDRLEQSSDLLHLTTLPQRVSHATAPGCSLRMVTTGAGFCGGTGSPCSVSSSTCSFIPHWSLLIYRRQHRRLVVAAQDL